MWLRKDVIVRLPWWVILYFGIYCILKYSCYELRTKPTIHSSQSYILTSRAKYILHGKLTKGVISCEFNFHVLLSIDIKYFTCWKSTNLFQCIFLIVMYTNVANWSEPNNFSWQIQTTIYIHVYIWININKDSPAHPKKSRRMDKSPLAAE